MNIAGGGILATVLHVLLLAAVVPTLAGVRRLVTRQRRGGTGPAPSQAWRDLQRLWRKGTAVPPGASPLAAAGPLVAVAAAALALLLVPSFTLGAATAPAADLVVVFGLLALSRAALAAAAHEGGPPDAFEAGRGVAAAVASGPPLVLVAMAALLLGGSTNLAAAAASVRDGGPGAHGAGVLAGMALFVLLLAEPPLPEPGSGRHRALAALAEMLRTTAILLVAAALALPFGLAPPGAGPDAWAVGAACAVLKLGVLSMAAAALERRPRPAALHPAAALLALAAAIVSGAGGPA